MAIRIRIGKSVRGRKITSAGKRRLAVARMTNDPVVYLHTVLRHMDAHAQKIVGLIHADDPVHRKIIERMRRMARKGNAENLLPVLADFFKRTRPRVLKEVDLLKEMREHLYEYSEKALKNGKLNKEQLERFHGTRRKVLRLLAKSLLEVVHAERLHQCYILWAEEMRAASPKQKKALADIYLQQIRNDAGWRTLFGLDST